MATSLGAGQKRCPKHTDVVHSSIEQCGQCRAERAVAVKACSPKVDTTQKRVNAAEARLRELACWNECASQMRDDPQVAVKWSAESSKWARVAMDLEEKITEIEHDQWLVEQDRLRGGSGN